MVRNQLRTLTPVNVTLPKASGGCAGIDFFAGSFSFINTEEFIQLLEISRLTLSDWHFSWLLTLWMPYWEGVIKTTIHHTKAE
ncbi:conjugal transfer protein TraH [Providencia rettgeri]|uniref:Conjugal transfer protein TraH n=1 Tax=Providencia rettgeri TaxID=587 RepID=A0A939NBC0_PRORE|nr:conjugal transfer protein TraH [Providencia rettgeri]